MEDGKKKVLVIMGSSQGPRCGVCGRVLGEDTERSNTQREKITAGSLYQPILFCRNDTCVQFSRRVMLTATKFDEVVLR